MVGHVLLTATRKFTRDCVPPCGDLKAGDVKKFVEFLSKSSKLLVVTGAGISTESGIPDYRSEGVGAYARNKNFVPVQYQTFVKSPSFRQRYWLKNYLGWDNLYNLKPNNGHLTLSRLEEDGKLLHVITQNVDSLHLKAGTKRVIELHGTAYRVICLSCPFQIERKTFQDILSKSNPVVTVKQFQLNPDGDVDIGEAVYNSVSDEWMEEKWGSEEVFYVDWKIPQLTLTTGSKNSAGAKYAAYFRGLRSLQPKFQEDVKAFSVPDCPDCGGVLKPDIVFFGDNVPKSRVQAVNDLIDECDALAVFGSSLTVQSSYRIVVRAHKLEKPTVAINIGRTRADDIIGHKIQAKCGDALAAAYTLLRKSEAIKNR